MTKVVESFERLDPTVEKIYSNFSSEKIWDKKPVPTRFASKNDENAEAEYFVLRRFFL